MPLNYEDLLKIFFEQQAREQSKRNAKMQRCDGCIVANYCSCYKCMRKDNCDGSQRGMFAEKIITITPNT